MYINIYQSYLYTIIVVIRISEYYPVNYHPINLKIPFKHKSPSNYNLFIGYEKQRNKVLFPMK